MKLSKLLFNIFVKNWWQKLTSLILTIFLWYFVVTQEQAEVEFTRVAWRISNLPENLEIVDQSTRTVSIRLRGSRTVINNINPLNLIAQTEDLPPNISEGEVTLRLAPEKLNLPAGVQVVYINPSYITVRLETRITKTVKVEPVIINHPPYGYELTNYIVEPDSVMIRGPRSFIEPVKSVYTDYIDLKGIIKSFTQRAQLKSNVNFLEFVSEKSVLVNIYIDKVYDIKTFYVPIKVFPPNEKIELKPSEIILILQGTYFDFKNFDHSKLLTLFNIGNLPVGEFWYKVKILNIPKQFKILQIIPSVIRVINID